MQADQHRNPKASCQSCLGITHLGRDYRADRLDADAARMRATVQTANQPAKAWQFCS